MALGGRRGLDSLSPWPGGKEVWIAMAGGRVGVGREVQIALDLDLG